MGEERIKPTQKEMDARFWRQTKLSWKISVAGVALGLIINYFDPNECFFDCAEVGVEQSTSNILSRLFVCFSAVYFVGIGFVRVLQRAMLVAALKERPMRPVYNLWFWKRWLLISDELIGVRL